LDPSVSAYEIMMGSYGLGNEDCSNKRAQTITDQLRDYKLISRIYAGTNLTKYMLKFLSLRKFF
jgi:hypothetical protein